MKNLNRNIYLLLIGIIEAIFIIYTVVISRRENIDTEELVFGCCSMAIMTAICIVVAFINKIGKKKEESPKLDLIEVPRAREGSGDCHQSVLDDGRLFLFPRARNHVHTDHPCHYRLVDCVHAKISFNGKKAYSCEAGGP